MNAATDSEPVGSIDWAQQTKQHAGIHTMPEVRTIPSEVLNVAERERAHYRKQLLEIRGVHQDAVRRELAEIIDRSERESRLLTPAESRTLDEGIRDNQSQGRIADVAGQAGPDTGVHRSFGSLLADGEYRALAPHESFDAAYRQKNAGQIEEVDAEKYFRALFGIQTHGNGAEQRLMYAGQDALGGYSIPEAMSTPIVDYARNAARVIQAGARTMPMESSDVRIVKLASDPTASWRGESQEIPESSPTVEGVMLRARTQAVLITMPVELFEDSVGLVPAVNNAIGAAIGLKTDYGALRGLGAENEPLGVRFTDGVTVTSLSGVLPTHSDLSNLAQAIVSANGPGPESQAIIYSPKTWGVFDRRADGEGLPHPGPVSYQQSRKFITNQIPETLDSSFAVGGGTETEVYRGVWEQLVIGVRTGIRLEVSRTSGDSFKKLQVQIRAYFRGDVAVIRPTWFAINTRVATA